MKSAIHGFSKLEAVVGLGLVIILMSVASTLIIPGLKKQVSGTQMVGNMRQLYLATHRMAVDGQREHSPELGWPGDTGGDVAHWASALVAGQYATPEEVAAWLSAPGRVTAPEPVTAANTNAVLVYAVREDSPTSTVFLTSANFTNTPTGGEALDPAARPFGAAGFVLFRKGGSGWFLQGRQLGPGYTNAIGTYAPLCR